MADFLGEARQAGCWCYGATAAPGDGRRGDADASGRERLPVVPYDSPDYREGGVVVVLGSEGAGLRPRVAGACDELIALPVRGRISSLGVGAAAAAILYEILQGRGTNP
jgi:23S rRNA (guanosine2251-2'-O)-methyltransferase